MNLFEEIVNELINTYKNESELNEFLRTKLNRELNEYAVSLDLYRIKVSSVVKNANDQDWLTQLLTEVISANTRNTIFPGLLSEYRRVLVTSGSHYHSVLLRMQKPFINRKSLRNTIKTLLTRPYDLEARILFVKGPKDTGKSYTIEYLTFLKYRINDFKLDIMDLERIAAEEPEISAWRLMSFIDNRYNIEHIALNNQNTLIKFQPFINKFCSKIRSKKDLHLLVIDGFNKANLTEDFYNFLIEFADSIDRQALDNIMLIIIDYDREIPLTLQHHIDETNKLNEKDLYEFFESILLHKMTGPIDPHHVDKKK